MGCPCDGKYKGGKCAWCKEAIQHNIPKERHNCAEGRKCT